MPARIYKAFLSLILSTLVFFLAVFPAFAQSNAQAAPTPLPAQNPLPSYIPPQSPTYANLTLVNIMHALSCIAAGRSVINQPCIEYSLSQDLQGKISTTPMLSSIDTSGGLIGAGGSLLTGMYTNPPLIIGDYLASVGKELGIVKEANAQVGGSGSRILNPVLELWQLSRNIAYLFMIIIFIIVGLMVMLRHKINPQTVISIQAAIPSLIIGLILITFSYFLAALITDIAFVGTDMVGYYFQIAQQKPQPNTLTQALETKNVFSLFAPFAGALSRADINAALDTAWDGIRGTSGPVLNPFGAPAFSAEFAIRTFVGLAAYQFAATFGPPLSQIIAGTACAIPGAFTAAGAVAAFTGCSTIGKIFGSVVLPPLFLAYGFLNPPFVVSFTIMFIAVFAVLMAMGKLLLRLINCYLSIIFYTITGPFHLLVSAIPGRQGIAINWMRNLLCNVLCFPAVGAVIYFAGYMLGSTHLPGSSGGVDLFANQYSLPLFGGFNVGALRALVAFGALLATPAVPDIICKAIGKPGAGGDLIGRAVQGSINDGRKYSDQFNEKLGKVSGDIGSYKDKLFGKKEHGGGILGDITRKQRESGTAIGSSARQVISDWAEGYRGHHGETIPSETEEIAVKRWA